MSKLYEAQIEAMCEAAAKEMRRQFDDTVLVEMVDMEAVMKAAYEAASNIVVVPDPDDPATFR